jgi:hypothetical protein
MAIELVTFIPFDLEANLGRAYNRAMAMLPADGWACLFDHDAMPTTREWYRQLVEVIEHRPDVGLVTAIDEPDRVAVAAGRARPIARITIWRTTGRSGRRASSGERSSIDGDEGDSAACS